MKLRIYDDCDTLYVEFADAAIARSAPLDDAREIDYASDGQAVGVTFLWISEGVSLEGVPHREELSPLLAKYNIRELVSR